VLGDLAATGWPRLIPTAGFAFLATVFFFPAAFFAFFGAAMPFQ